MTTQPEKRLAYNAPHQVFYPTVFFFLLFIYIMLVSVPGKDGKHLRVPPYLLRMEAVIPTLPVDSTSRSLVELGYEVCSFFEREIADHFFTLGLFIFRSRDNMMVVLILAFLIHCFEMGIAYRICRSCKATLPVMALYLLGTALGGFTQVFALQDARKAYLETAVVQAKEEGEKTRVEKKND
ncbi:hypothetical protein AGDE_00747 [Angomonas deanei]|uniref:Uncharacterized protein n=1 Tax=Angomonas deanei TaxID=59799 RepID=A0A7G2C0G1_9TRYP|nr:hypothetical protein AGDE_00747 [Angomonas deanei]CAD2212804.1 Domain of unknown function (DUF4499), putative [Angomonas deanei]|eukprot:EPY43175.1 hypothetical protein AGDE_00747 [Angomonas deanei]